MLLLDLMHSPRAEENRQIIIDYKKNVEKELRDTCNRILFLLEKTLISGLNAEHYKNQFKDVGSAAEREAKAQSAHREAEVFFWKMKGDYHRYVAEYMKPGERNEPGDKAIDAYKKASQAAEKSVSLTRRNAKQCTSCS